MLGRAAECEMGARKKRSSLPPDPWDRFLAARAELIARMHDRGDNDSTIVYWLSLNERMVKMIRERPPVAPPR